MLFYREPNPAHLLNKSTYQEHALGYVLCLSKKFDPPPASLNALTQWPHYCLYTAYGELPTRKILSLY
jgi:hypothetical protein